MKSICNNLIVRSRFYWIYCSQPSVFFDLRKKILRQSVVAEARQSKIFDFMARLIKIEVWLSNLPSTMKRHRARTSSVGISAFYGSFSPSLRF